MCVLSPPAGCDGSEIKEIHHFRIMGEKNVRICKIEYCSFTTSAFIIISTNAINVLGLRSAYVRWEGFSVQKLDVVMASFLSLANVECNAMSVG